MSRKCYPPGLSTMDSHAHEKKNIKKGPSGGWGVPNFYPKPYFLGDLKLCAIFHNPRTTPSGRKVVGGE
jgi:hypothetical protein